MYETAQPQAGEPANQPDVISAPDSESEERQAFMDEEDRSEQTPDEPFMTVRYNKQDKPLSKEEAVTYAQKGMNYDKLQERLKEVSAKLSGYESAGLTAGRASDKQAVIDGQLESFMRGNPGVDPRKLPESVIAAWKRGVPLSEAFISHQAQTLSAKIGDMEKASAQAEVNRKNNAASMGGAVSNAPARAKAINEESIRSMTCEELDKNHERIWACLTGK